MHGCVIGFEHFGHGHRGLHHMRRGGGPHRHGRGHHGHGPHGFGHHGHGPFGFGLHGFGHHGHGPHGFGPHGHGPHGFGDRGHGPHGFGPHGKFGHGKHGCKKHECKKHGSEHGDIFEQFLAFREYCKMARPDAIASQTDNEDDTQNSACEKERDSDEERDCNESAEKPSCSRQRMRPSWGKRRCHKMHKTMEGIRKVRSIEKQCKCGKRGAGTSTAQDTSASQQGPSAPPLDTPAEAVAAQEAEMTSADKPTTP